MTQSDPIKLHYQYDGKTQYHALTTNVVLREVAEALKTFSPASLEHSQNFLADIARKLQEIQERSRLDCQRFKDYSNQKQKDYESDLEKLRVSQILAHENESRLQKLFDALSLRNQIWSLLGYSYTYDILTCYESATNDAYRLPRLFVSPEELNSLLVIPHNHCRPPTKNYLEKSGFNLFVPDRNQICLVEAKLAPLVDLSISRIPAVIYSGGGATYRSINGALDFLDILVNYINTMRELQNDDHITFKSSYYGAEITSTNQLFRFFFYVEKKINLLINKVELIQEQGKIFGSLSEDIFRQELGNSVVDLINVINLEVPEMQLR